MMTLDQMRERALRHPGDYALWTVCAEICERLDRLLARDKLVGVGTIGETIRSQEPPRPPVQQPGVRQKKGKP